MRIVEYKEMDFLILLEGLRTDFFIKLFEIITMLGETTTLVILIAILYFAFDKHFARKLLFITLFSMGLNGVVKNIVKRPRPFSTGKVSSVREKTATGYSFPSGHTQNFSTWSTVFAAKYKKLWITVLVGIGIFLVAFSRMFLGVHYPGDVTAGAILGVVISVVGSIVYDIAKDKNRLYVGAVIVLTPFAILFLFGADAHFADFYKLYGMLIGFACAVRFEDKYAPLEYDRSVWQKVLRVVIGIGIALVVKGGTKVFDVFDVVQLSLAVAVVRYMILIFVVLGLCPLLFKKMKI